MVIRFDQGLMYTLGTIQVLRRHVFDFLGPPTSDDLQYSQS